MALVLVSPLHAQWLWKDKDGRKVFSDRPPPQDIPDANILKRPPAISRTAGTGDDGNTNNGPGSDAQPNHVARPVATPAGVAQGEQAAKGVDKELAERKKRALEEEAAKQRAEKEKIDQIHSGNCARARQSLASINSGVRIARTNAQGEREFMDEKALSNERQLAEQIIASDCK